MSYFKLLSIFCMLSIVILTFFCCNVQKRKYSNGFYYSRTSGLSKVEKHNLDDKNEDLLPTKNNKNLIEIVLAKENSKKGNPQFVYEKLIAPKVIGKLKKIVQFDSIPKNRHTQIENKSKIPPKKIEIFTQLALVVYALYLMSIILILLAILIPFVSVFFYYLGLAFIILPILQIILAGIGNKRSQKRFDKYKNPSLADYLFCICLVTSWFGFLLWYIYAIKILN